jgi:hypothetical protein
VNQAGLPLGKVTGTPMFYCNTCGKHFMFILLQALHFGFFPSRFCSFFEEPNSLQAGLVKFC